MINYILKNKWHILFCLFWVTCAFADGDELSSIMGSARDNFGSGSTFIKLLYASEIIAGGYAWHKTKHPSAVIGIVILAVFMTFALKHWVFN